MGVSKQKEDWEYCVAYCKAETWRALSQEVIDGVSPAIRRVLLERCRRKGNRLDTLDLRRFKNEAMDPNSETHLAKDSKTLERILRWIASRGTGLNMSNALKRTAKGK